MRSPVSHFMSTHTSHLTHIDAHTYAHTHTGTLGHNQNKCFTQQTYVDELFLLLQESFVKDISFEKVEVCSESESKTVHTFWSFTKHMKWVSFYVSLFLSDQDGAEPSANSVSALNLLRLSHYTGRKDWSQRSQQLLAAFSDRLTRVPIALPEMVRGLMANHYTLKQVTQIVRSTQTQSCIVWSGTN